MAADVALVHQLAPKARVLVTTYWNVFQDGDVVTDAATRRANDTLTTQFNAALVTSIGQSATVVDLYEPFKGGGDLDPTPCWPTTATTPTPPVTGSSRPRS
ncbi:hypothetical protein GCM10025862_32760 [Arsenicicoccus piscis]|uniref:Uncharacterized protein n=1 Tax=Arsenicicoccus piscis TaxID=673954 RepID=A0ABQ6HUL5_9MICO|nr:hypothetical protein GCM10025862_32760 [Arsenicicoccus piscis]